MTDFFERDPMILAQIQNQKAVERQEQFFNTAIQQLNQTILRLEQTKVGREEFKDFRNDMRRDVQAINDAVSAMVGKPPTIAEITQQNVEARVSGQTDSKWKAAIWAMASAVATAVVTAGLIQKFGIGG